MRPNPRVQPTPPSAREIVAFVRLFTRGGVAPEEPCLNRDTRAEWPALARGTR